MSKAETVESYLYRSEVPHDQVEDSTWVIQLNDTRSSRVVLRIQEPIILFSSPVLDLADDTPDREKLFRTLLELNAELLHCGYALEGDRIVLTGAQELQNLDYNEFQAVVDDMTMAKDTHQQKLSSWATDTSEAEA